MGEGAYLWQFAAGLSGGRWLSGVHDFHTLSPLDFEEMVRDLLQAEWRVRLESFGSGADRGVDARLLNGPDQIVIQAKHMLGSGYRALLRVLPAERDKMIALAPNRYVLATSLTLTQARKDEIVAAMAPVPLVPPDVLGQEDLNNLLRSHDMVERQHYKLWLSSIAVLERILQAGVYNRTAAEMDIIREMVPRFVQNGSVEEAEAKLAETGALIIAGPPGVGKSTLARILLWRHAEQGWRVFVVDSLDEAITVADPGERRLILLDDFLGQVRLSEDHVRGIDARLPPLLSRVAAHENLRFVLTTRDYILAQARGLSARLDAGRIKARDYVLDVSRYTRSVRARILYNHLYFSALAPEQRDEVLADDFFLKVIDHKNFSPRIIEEVSNPEFLAIDDRGIRDVFAEVLENPALLWDRPYRQHVGAAGRALMLALFVNGRSAGVAALKASYVRVSRALELTLHSADVEASFRSTYRLLDGSVMSLVHGMVLFSNPGVRDYLQAAVIGDGLVNVLLREIETPNEIAELWSVFQAQGAGRSGAAVQAQEWADALDRMDEGGFATRYEYLRLAIDICSGMGGDALEQRLARGIKLLEDESMDGGDVAEACELLETAFRASINISLEERLRRTVTAAAATLLAQHGDELGLEDLQSLDSAIHEYGMDEDILNEASRVAEKAIECCIASEIDQIGSVEELDEFERDLKSYFAQRNYLSLSVHWDLDRRRARLADEGRMEPERSYQRRSTWIGDIDASDDEIRSMFRGLARS